MAGTREQAARLTASLAIRTHPSTSGRGMSTGTKSTPKPRKTKPKGRQSCKVLSAAFVRMAPSGRPTVTGRKVPIPGFGGRDSGRQEATSASLPNAPASKFGKGMLDKTPKAGRSHRVDHSSARPCPCPRWLRPLSGVKWLATSIGHHPSLRLWRWHPSIRATGWRHRRWEAATAAPR